MKPISDTKKKAAILGVGLDAKDGHKRITQAEKFAVVGGSEETHDRMTETLVKTFEDLKRRGRELENAPSSEVAELIHKNTPR
ncbi:hypothetical protein [Cerasicoccus arenae]|uniref:Uncharacterized protein n=1 Tax=Cerasicoccus arenae TaxID=424488 RepID=A0A8J3GDA7_9BACT|nr:hypothetical protein [Cerasicoccus arenae]MBK1857218.1 hypothetical protein [Cerasicoccus arenae]GHC00067.1 hypothetical protein GCM10007047_15380 [Cerasicoccus arenae]